MKTQKAGCILVNGVSKEIALVCRDGEYSFPKGFEWGSSTAGHQIEGDNVNSGHWDREQTLLKENPNYEVSGKACNSYEMYE